MSLLTQTEDADPLKRDLLEWALEHFVDPFGAFTFAQITFEWLVSKKWVTPMGLEDAQNLKDATTRAPAQVFTLVKKEENRDHENPA
jgi:hypothetical protein